MWQQDFCLPTRVSLLNSLLIGQFDILINTCTKTHYGTRQSGLSHTTVPEMSTGNASILPSSQIKYSHSMNINITEGNVESVILFS